MTKLEARIAELDEQLLDIITGGKLGLYSNMDVLQLKPGEGMKIQDLLSRRNEVVRLWKEENARNKTQEEKEVDADTTGVVGESNSGKGSFSE